MLLSTIQRNFHRPAANWIRLLAIAGVLALTPLAFVSLGLLIFATTRVFKLRFGILTSLMLSFMALTAFVSMIAAGAWLVGAPLSAAFILIAGLAVVLLLLCLTPTASQPNVLPARGDLFQADDWIACIVAIACMIVVCIPLLPRPSAATVLPVLMYGGDNSAHLDMFRTIDRNQGFAIGDNNRANLGGILVAYPQGWHFMAVFVKWTLQGIVPIGASPTSVLLFFYITGVAWLGILAMLITRLALLVVRRLTKPHLPMQTIISSGTLVGASCFISINGYLLSLFAYGFQTQVAALGFLLAEVLIIVAAYLARTPRQRFSYLLLATLLLAGGGFSWLFLYPIGALLLLGAVAHTVIANRRLPLYFAIGLIILAGGVLFQPLVQILVPVPAFQDGVNVINQRGNVALTDMLTLGLLALAVSIWAYAYFRDTTIRILVSALGIAMVFSLALMWYQLNTIAELRYYYYKSTYTAIIFVLILLAAFVGWLTVMLMSLKTPFDRPQWLHKPIIGLSILGMLVMGAHLATSPTYDGFINKSLAGISSAQAGTVVDIVDKQPNNAWRVLSIGSCNRGDDIRATLLAGSLGAIPPRGTKSPGAFIRLDNIDKQVLFASIEKFVSQDGGMPSLIILSNDQVIGAQLMQRLGADLGSKIQLINLDPSIETEPATQCFDRVR